MSDSNSLCKELHLKLIIDPPISVSVVRYLEPNKMSFDDGQSCACSSCLGESRIMLRLHYSNDTEAIILSMDQALQVNKRWNIDDGLYD